MTPTAHHYTRIHADARRRELLRAASQYGKAFAVTAMIVATLYLTFGDVIQRTAADAVAAQNMGGW